MNRFVSRSLLVAPLCALLAGCLTTSPEEQAKLNEERCINRGYKPGTDDFKDCVVRVDGERDQLKETRRRYEMEKPYNPVTNQRGF